MSPLRLKNKPSLIGFGIGLIVLAVTTKFLIQRHPKAVVANTPASLEAMIKNAAPRLPAMPASGDHAQLAPQPLATPSDQPPPKAPESVQGLQKVMEKLSEAMKSESAAALVLKDYQACVEQATAYPGAQAVCVRNAQLIGERYPNLRASAQQVVSQGAKFQLPPTQVAPPLSAPETPGT